MNTVFEHIDVYKYIWYRPSMAQKSLTDVCIVSSDLFSEVFGWSTKTRSLLNGSTPSNMINTLLFALYELQNVYRKEKGSKNGLTYQIKWEVLADKESEETDNFPRFLKITGR